MQLACLEVDPLNEVNAKKWLKSELPRRSRVNLRPKGANDGVLYARVTPKGSEKDLTETMIQLGLGTSTCST